MEETDFSGLVLYVFNPQDVEDIPFSSEVQLCFVEQKKLKTLSFTDLIFVPVIDLELFLENGLHLQKLQDARATSLVYLPEGADACSIALLARNGFSHIYIGETDLREGLVQLRAKLPQNALLRKSLEYAGVFIFYIIHSDDIRMSPLACYFLGLDRVDTVRSEIIEERIHPADRVYVKTVFTNVFSKSACMHFEFRIANRHNKFQWVKLSVEKRMNDVFATGFAQVVGKEKDLRRKLLDKTIALIKSNETLRNIQKIAGIGVWIYNAMNQTISFSSKIAELLQVEGVSSCQLVDFMRLIVPSDRELFKANVLNQTLNVGGVQVECRINTQGGKMLYLRIVVLKHRRRPANYPILEGTMQDITREKQHEKELETKNKQLEKFNRNIIIHTQEVELAKRKAEENDKLKTAFISNLTHEIRTPLSTIGGFAELLQSDFLDDEKRTRYLKQILQANKHLLQIFSDVLDLSRINSNQLILNKVDTNVDHLLEEIYYEYKQLVRYPDVVLKFDKSVDATHCCIDAEKTKRVVAALLDNALKFTSAGEILIDYSLGINELSISISDSGIGIPFDEIEKIYAPFKQIDNSLSRNFGGTGLGLSIVKALIDFMGGEIAIESEEHRGTKVMFTLPVD